MFAFVALTALANGCGSDDRVPDRLLDGSPARSPATALRGIDGPAILTSVHTRPVTAVGSSSPAGSCLGRDWGSIPEGLVVERTGVTGESVTFLNGARHEVLGCDGGGLREHEHDWCGVAAGDIRSGHLRDPRLDLGCSTEHGDQLGFVWVEPGGAARYVAVQQPGYSEVYEVAGGLPVRIATTSDIDGSSLSASFAVSEYSSTGRLLRAYGVTASPAG